VGGWHVLRMHSITPSVCHSRYDIFTTWPEVEWVLMSGVGAEVSNIALMLHLILWVTASSKQCRPIMWCSSRFLYPPVRCSLLLWLRAWAYGYGASPLLVELIYTPAFVGTCCFWRDGLLSRPGWLVWWSVYLKTVTRNRVVLLIETTVATMSDLHHD